MNITHHTKNQEDLKLHEKRPSRYFNIKMTEMLQLSDKDFKAGIIKMIKINKHFQTQWENEKKKTKTVLAKTKKIPAKKQKE